MAKVSSFTYRVRPDADILKPSRFGFQTNDVNKTQSAGFNPCARWSLREKSWFDLNQGRTSPKYRQELDFSTFRSIDPSGCRAMRVYVRVWRDRDGEPRSTPSKSWSRHPCQNPRYGAWIECRSLLTMTSCGAPAARLVKYVVSCSTQSSI